MKQLLVLLVIGLMVIQCKTTQQQSNVVPAKVAIENDSIEYDIIVTDIGYERFLLTIAKPMEFYSKEYYELKNRLYVPLYNQQVRTARTGKWSQIFEQEIEYDPTIDYGLELNYKLYNYFKFIEYTYKIKLL
jgi:hypothetical protein